MFNTMHQLYLKATNRGPIRYTDMLLDIPNYLNTHGYFNSESMHYWDTKLSCVKCIP